MKRRTKKNLMPVVYEIPPVESQITTFKGRLGYACLNTVLRCRLIFAKCYGHRLTAHPGQFTQLASPKQDVVTASVRELDYHCQMFRHMVCEELSIPIVFDYHHNWINPSIHPLPELIERINKIWHRKGIKPKQHLSSPRPGAESIMEKRAHADRCYTLPPELPDDMDLMIEAKDKEQAVFHLYRIYGLESEIIMATEKPKRPMAESPQKRKARVRGKNKRKAMAEDTDEGSDVAEVGTSKVAKKTKVKVKTGAKQRNNASKVQELMDQEE
ncbi:UV-damage endonuclease [Grifola frondosa]|uniref:UV-damage endonuclease n=1 Tax=Grifola frondosa TaxID=5627 RepID=A0A1C7MN68_GRIFR|nr:UV-damage endonuclease [Grifola frondosa]